MACITVPLAAIGDALFGGGAAAAGLTAADVGITGGLASTAASLGGASLMGAADAGAFAGLGAGALGGAAVGAIPGIVDATAGAIPEQVLVTGPAAAASSGIDPVIAGIGGAGGALSTLAGTPMDASPASVQPIDNTAGMTPEQVTITAPQPDAAAPGSAGVQPVPMDPFSIDLPMDQVNNLTVPATQSGWGDSLMGDVAHVGESLGINSALRYILGGGTASGVPGAGAAGSGAGSSAGTGGASGGGGGGSGVPGGQQDFSGSSGALSRASGTAAKGLSNTALTLGALSALGSAFGRPKSGATAIPGPASTAATRGPLFGAPLATGAFSRTAVPNYMPATGSFYTYGQQPEPAFFTGNQVALPNFGFAGGGAISRHVRSRPFATAAGEHFVRGPGTGTSDSVPARLSDGEYVLTAADVARIGGGSNEAGARKLDHARTQLARSTGSGRIMRKPKGTGFLAKAAAR